MILPSLPLMLVRRPPPLLGNGVHSSYPCLSPYHARRETLSFRRRCRWLRSRKLLYLCIASFLYLYPSFVFGSICVPFGYLSVDSSSTSACGTGTARTTLVLVVRPRGQQIRSSRGLQPRVRRWYHYRYRNRVQVVLLLPKHVGFHSVCRYVCHVCLFLAIWCSSSITYHVTFFMFRMVGTLVSMISE